MIDTNKITIEELAAMAREKSVRIKISIEPNGYGQIHEKMEIVPWEKYEPICPHGVPIVYAKED